MLFLVMFCKINILRFIVTAHALQPNEPSDKGLGDGLVGMSTRMLNNLYVERVLRRNIRNAPTYLIWHWPNVFHRFKKTVDTVWRKKRLKGQNGFFWDNHFLIWMSSFVYLSYKCRCCVALKKSWRISNKMHGIYLDLTLQWIQWVYNLVMSHVSPLPLRSHLNMWSLKQIKCLFYGSQHRDISPCRGFKIWTTWCWSRLLHLVV